MATTDARTATGDDPRVGSVYDGFISYAHAADDLLAPRLQAGLQRFAKPWWKRRAVRIFRDDASLSANPHLWGSITEAMDGSGWFVLLLSPDASESEWVNREVEYWRSTKTRTGSSQWSPTATSLGATVTSTHHPPRYRPRCTGRFRTSRGGWICASPDQKNSWTSTMPRSEPPLPTSHLPSVGSQRMSSSQRKSGNTDARGGRRRAPGWPWSRSPSPLW